MARFNRFLRGFRRGVADRFEHFLEEARTAPENLVLMSGISIMDLESDDQKEIVDLGFRFLVDTDGIDLNDEERWKVLDRVGNLVGRLLGEPLPFTVAELPRIVATAARLDGDYVVAGTIETVRRMQGDTPPSSELHAALERLRSCLVDQARSAEIKRIDALLSGDWSPSLLLDAADAWSATMVDLLDASGDARPAWEALLDHCATATQPKPSKRWLKTADGLVDALGGEDHAAGLASVLEAVGTTSPVPVDMPGTSWQPTARVVGHPTQVSDRFADMLRGMVWSTLTHADHQDALIPRVGDAAERCFTKLPNHGPLAPKIGNACLVVLGRAESLAAVGQLARLESRAKHASTRKQISKALDAAAAALGMSAVDLEELGAPTGGLTTVGRWRDTIGDFTAEILVEGARAVTLRWHTPPTSGQSGKLQKTVPKAVKDEHPVALKRVKKQVAELRKLLPPQRDRVERMLRSGRALAFADWRERYLDHPLVGVLGRRLIWRIDDPASGDPASGDGVLVAWSPGSEGGDDGDGHLVDVEDGVVEVADDARVRLWHPASSPATVVAAWQAWLARHDVTQPFKQAHREIYLLTDAERATGTYSNRFAAHVLKQHQFHALCQARGWSYTLQGRWDSHNTPFIDLPDADSGPGLRARFAVDPIDEEQITESYVYLYLSTDRVELQPLETNRPMPLEEVPPLVLSELMRDVDLFVGVASVGNDPTWRDGGPEGRHAAYWNDFSFGQLDAHAETRRAVLETLLPKLKIADRCTIDGRFLEVRGRLRTYRIHIGSANIQMSPNNQYLCIVAKPSSRAAGTVTLPFEGDSKLSLILSKAFMLADDHKIKDSTIVNQIRNA